MKTLLGRLVAGCLAATLILGAVPALALFQFSDGTRNAANDAIETAIGTAPVLRLYDGTLPLNCAAARNGTIVAEMTLPSDWLSASSSGSKTLLGVWQDSAANAAGSVDYFTIFNSAGTTCHIQGTATNTGGGGDLQLQNININAGQTVTITSFALNMGGG